MGSAASASAAAAFQSLIGIIEDFDCKIGPSNEISVTTHVSIPDRDYRGFRLPTSETLAVFGFQGSIATTSSNYSISALGFDNSRPQKSFKSFLNKPFSYCDNPLNPKEAVNPDWIRDTT
ncbi:hypothetical protein [Coleofasciculus chthonoplastes]|uniref:hypothetical protein n=1 Tax=Coleofasciculus chthonoplastes TaxID=64178 RepID=UPI0040628551